MLLGFLAGGALFLFFLISEASTELKAGFLSNDSFILERIFCTRDSFSMEIRISDAWLIGFFFSCRLTGSGSFIEGRLLYNI